LPKKESAMPGTFTHFMVTEAALDKYCEKHANDADPLLGRLQPPQRDPAFPFLLLGAVSPDYPFIAERKPKPERAAGNWGNRMHGANTGAMINSGLAILRVNRPIQQPPDLDICQAWLFGYASHLVADTVIHPIVNLAVGGLAFCTEKDHGFCEITQDAWIFRRRKQTDIKGSDYIAQLHHCSDPNPGRDPRAADGPILHRTVETFWAQCLRGAHPLAAAENRNIAPTVWHQALLELLPAATGGGLLKYIGSVFFGMEERFYEPLDEIERDHPERLEKYVVHPKVPTGTSGGVREGSFLEAFDRAVDKLVEVWERMVKDMADMAANPKYLPPNYDNWDLDAGVKMPVWEPGLYDGLNQIVMWA
jgi:hypothetical protein